MSRSIRSAVAVMLPMAGLLATFAQAGLTDCVFIGPSGGNFGTVANWDCGNVPTAANHAIIDGKAPLLVMLNDSRTVGALTVGVDDELSHNNNTTLTVPDITNDGVISLNSAGNLTNFRISGNPTNLDGSGTLLMGPDIQNRIDGQFFDIPLVNGADHTIRGSGQIGVNVIDLVNHGVVRADQAAAVLQLDLRNGAANNINTGTLLAASGGTLVLVNSTIDNSTGQIRANNNSFVDLSGSTIIGGDYTTSGTGLIRFISGGLLTNFTNTGHMSILNNVSPRLGGTIVNDALIDLNSTGNATQLLIETNPTTFTGSGEIVMGADFQNRISGQFFDFPIVNDVDHTIRGSGQIGLNVIDMVNHGLVRADNPGLNLQFDLRNGTANNQNNSVMEAVNGATLTLLNSAIDNTNGLMRADVDSFFDIFGSTIIGGDYTTSGTGLIRFTSGGLLHDFTNTGHMSILNNVSTRLGGTIVNDSLISLESVGNATQLLIETNPTTFTGSGEIVMGENFQNRISGQFFDIPIVNDVNHTIRGSGQIGLNVIDMVNNGLIQADNPAVALQFDLRNGTANNQNNAIMEAVNGATMTLSSSSIDNSNGLMRAGADSFFDIFVSVIVGGELTTVGSGLMRSTNSTLNGVTNTGHISIPNNTTTTFANTTTNESVISMDSEGNQTNFRISSNPTTITGPGELVMGPNFQNRIDGAAFDIPLVNAAGHTIRGAGQIGVNVIDIINLGSIIADDAATMSIDQRNTFVNEGLIHVTDDGALTIQTGPFTTSGFVTIDATRTLTRTGNFDQTGGVTIVNGTLTLIGGNVQLTGGIFAGDGQVSSSFNNTGGAIAPGNSAGSLNLQGQTYAQGAGGAFLAEIGGEDQGTEYDHLIVAGNAFLDGELVVTRINAFQPTPGVEFTILTAFSRQGEFATISACDPIEVIYTPTEVKVVFGKQTGIVGDLNGDDEVNGSDLGQLLLVFGPCGTGCCTADFNEDSIVDGADLGTLLLNWTE